MSEVRAHDPNLVQVIAIYLATADGKNHDELVMDFPGSGKVLMWHTYLPRALKVLDIVGDYLQAASQLETSGNTPETREAEPPQGGEQRNHFDALAADTEAEAGNGYEGADSAAKRGGEGRPKL